MSLLLGGENLISLNCFPVSNHTAHIPYPSCLLSSKVDMIVKATDKLGEMIQNLNKYMEPEDPNNSNPQFYRRSASWI